MIIKYAKMTIISLIAGIIIILMHIVYLDRVITIMVMSSDMTIA